MRKFVGPEHKSNVIIENGKTFLHMLVLRTLIYLKTVQTIFRNFIQKGIQDNPVLYMCRKNMINSKKHTILWYVYKNKSYHIWKKQLTIK